MAGAPLDLSAPRNEEEGLSHGRAATVKRTSGIESNFLWDKSAYSLGVTAGEGRRTSIEHAAFVVWHCEGWLHRPMMDFSPPAFSRWLVARPVHWARMAGRHEGPEYRLRPRQRTASRCHDPRPSGGSCPLGTVHRVKVINGRKLVSSPASMLRRRDCIQPSRASGTRYLQAPRSSPSTSTPSPPTTTNKATTRPYRKPLLSPIRQCSIAFLSAIVAIAFRLVMPPRCSGRILRMRWQPGGGGLFLGFIDQKDAEAVELKKIGSILAKIRAGRPIADFRPDLPQGVRFFVLALAPNVHGSRCGSTSRMISA